MSTHYILPLKAPTPLPASGVNIVTFKVWKNTLIAHIQQDANHFHFMPGGKYSIWRPAEYGARIQELAAGDPDKTSLDEKRAADPPQLTATQYANEQEKLLSKRNALLSKFITHIATLCHITENDDVTNNSSSLDWIFQ